MNTFLKWSATTMLIIGTGVNAFDIYPLGPMILAFGGMLWLIVSIRWREPALIATNSFLVFIGVAGLIINLGGFFD